MNNENKIYAAYGSNMNLEQMGWRCPYARVLGNAVLPGYRLMFRGGGGSAVATVERKKGSTVPVLLWDITPRDEESLDRYEGWPHLYRKEMVTVLREGKPVSAMVYIMNPGRPLGQPGLRYFQSIMDGYANAGFDNEVLSKTVKDSINKRRKTNE